MDTKIKLSTLWVVVMFNMVFADIFSIIIALTDDNVLDIPGDTRTIMGIAAIITNIPIFMIFLSRVLSFKWNKIFNIAAAIFTIVYIIRGGSLTLHYLIIGSIEIIILLLIIYTTIQWKK